MKSSSAQFTAAGPLSGGPAQAPAYRLQPGLELVATEAGGVLLSLRPLMAMRLNARAFALLSMLKNECTVDRTAELSVGDASKFLDRLANRRLLIRQPPIPKQWPMVSIIVPARGRPTATRACIKSLLDLDYPTEYREILVVDDASDPPLIIDDMPVRLLRQDHNIGQSAARNLAAQEARGELLAFIDNDCVAEPDWLRALIPHLSAASMGIVGGRVIAPPSTGRVSAFEAVRSPLDMGPIGGEVGPNEVVSYLPTCNLIVRRELLLALGGFDVAMRLGEDVDFIWRTLDTGTRARYVPDGKIVHYHRDQLWSLLRRRADYGSSEAVLQHQHRKGRRLMRLPITGLVVLASLVLGTVWWPASALLAMFALTGIALEIQGKLQRVREFGADLPVQRVRMAVLREHCASFYHLSANIVRYYSVPLLAIALIWSNTLPAFALLLLIAPITDYYRLQPSMTLPRFVGFYLLEMGGYQWGVWQGCINQRTLRPLMPTIQIVR